MNTRLAIRWRHAAAVLLLAAGGAAAETPARHPVSIGQSAALSTPQAAQSHAFLQGARLYFDRVNAGGGVHGRPIELRTLDDGGDPARAAANTRRFLDEGVLSLFGYAGTGAVDAAHPAARHAGAVLFAPLSGDDELRGPNYPQVFALRPSYGDEMLAVARHARLAAARRFLILHTDDAESLAALRAARQVLRELGLEPVAVSLQQSGLPAAIDKALAPGVDAVVVVADPRGSAVAVRYLRVRHYGGPVYALSTAGEDLLARDIGEDAAGVIATRLVPRAAVAHTVSARELMTDAARLDVVPNAYMMEGYIAARVLAGALQAAGPNPTRERLKQALEAMRDIDAGGFPVRFRKDRTASHAVELTFIDAKGRLRE